VKIKQPFDTVALALPFPAAPVAIVSAVAAARGLVPGGTALTIVSSVIAGGAVNVTVAAGADGERYLVTVRATDAGGLAMEREAELAVVDLSWAVPTLAGPYLSAAAFVERLGLDDAILITATSDGGRIDAARLQRAIDDAQGEAESYLAARYQTPLSPVPATIETIVFDLAVARLYTAEVPPAVADRQARAQKQLRDIADGKVTIPGAAALVPAAIAPAPVLFQGNDRLLSRETLKGF
jgi:phage gp36-like protein